MKKNSNVLKKIPRDATEFAGKRLLLIGSSYSAEDIALQCLKYRGGDNDYYYFGNDCDDYYGHGNDDCDDDFILFTGTELLK